MLFKQLGDSLVDVLFVFLWIIAYRPGHGTPPDELLASRPIDINHDSALFIGANGRSGTAHTHTTTAPAPPRSVAITGVHGINHSALVVVAVVSDKYVRVGIDLAQALRLQLGSQRIHDSIVDQVVDFRIPLSCPTEGTDLRKISLPVIIDTGRQIASQDKQERDQQEK